MVRCKVVIDFYDNVEEINRKRGEIFECLEGRAEYLSGKKEQKIKVVDVIEVIPDENVSQEPKEETPKKKGRKKIDTVE